MKSSTRNLIIFSLSAALSGWLGIWLNTLTGNTMPPLQSLGALVWLVTPTVTGLALRATGGDGWQDAGFALKLIPGWRWYLAALFIYPLLTMLGFGISLAAGSINANGFAVQGFGAYLSAVGFIFVGSLMKNLFEEFAWRGYLTPRLHAAQIHPQLGHAITAVIWWAWHLPYYYYFLPKADLQAATPYGLAIFLALGLFVLYPTSILFAEIRLGSKSVWTAFLLHQVINAISMPFMLNGFISSNHWGSLILSPTNDSVLMSVFMGAVGLWIYRLRTGKIQKD